MKKLILISASLILFVTSISIANSAESKRLNNLVVELLNTGVKDVKSKNEFKFTNPYDGWVFVSLSTKLRKNDTISLSIDDSSQLNNVIVESASDSKSEAMRFLSKGDHVLKLQVKGRPQVTSLIVRSIPELIYGDFPENPYVYNSGLYNWEYIQKNLASNINKIVASAGILDTHQDAVDDWVSQGKKWIFHSGVPGLGAAPLEESYSYWHNHMGMQDPRIGGIIIDEFPGGSEDPKYTAWAEAIDKLYQDPKLKDKVFYPFVYGKPIYEGKTSRAFADTVAKNKGKFAIEYYIAERLDAQKLLDAFEGFQNDMGNWQKNYPGGVRNVVLGFGSMSAPRESLNIDPSVDFKWLMDKQMNIAANDPRFEGLFGIHHYKNSYTDEENLRWASALYRHYCIEGNKTMLSDKYGFKYELNHIANPDFDDGLNGWTINAAEAGSIKPGNLPGWGWLECRYPKSPKGDNYLLMKRSEKGPNTISQTIKNLVPGKWYSMKMFSADYNDILNTISNQRSPVLAIKIDNALVSSRSFDQLMTNDYDINFGKFDEKYKAWFVYYWRVFQAKGSTATLSISDWTSKIVPGGPAGQEIMANFIEVQPFFVSEK